jgi:hypothetical protein
MKYRPTGTRNWVQPLTRILDNRGQNRSTNVKLLDSLMIIYALDLNFLFLLLYFFVVVGLINFRV